MALAVLLWLAAGPSVPAVRAQESPGREEFRRELSLVRNSPNPFNPVTNISFNLLKAAHVRIDVYDLRGRRVECLLDEWQEEGRGLAVWKTETAPSGTYILSLQADGVRVFRKMSLIR